ncbi:MAG: glycosyltransferase [Thermodesulforhabdaceae bacterium]
MKILYLHANAELYGSDLILLQLVTYLDKTRYEPIVFLPVNGPLIERLREAGIRTMIMPLAVLRRAHFTPSGVIRFVTVLMKSVSNLRRFILKERIALVHTNTGAVWGGELAAAITGIPHVSSVMEIVEKPKIVSLAMSWMVSAFSDQVITVSGAVRDHFIKYTPWWREKYIEMFPPVDTVRFSPDENARKIIRSHLGIDENTVLVGMAGRLNHWKGQDVFVRACKEVMKMLDYKSDVHFVILGGPVPGREEFVHQLHRDIEELGLVNVVTAPGFQENITDWLSAMDVFVLPSKLPEPSSTGVVAAMAMGLPVVGTNIGGTPETVLDGETGFLVPPNDPKSLAEKISLLVKDSEMRRSMGAKAMERARKLYSIESYVGKVMAIYDDLLQNTRK